MQPKRALAERPTLTLSRTYGASPDKVWRAWTDPQALKIWFKPERFTVPLAEADVRTGGRFRVVMTDPNGKDYEVSGVYRQVILTRKLVLSWNWKDQPGESSLLTVSLRALGKGTELTLVHEGYLDREPPVTTHEEGWNGALNQLASFLDEET
jgi:uncharacterized protein YndB with AHSA1/START domain